MAGGLGITIIKLIFGDLLGSGRGGRQQGHN